MIADYYVEAFTAEEQQLLAPHVTNLDRPVFALTNLPQVTAAALFARYSRSSKSLRRLLVDEFLAGGSAGSGRPVEAGRERASDLFGRVLAEYGDDSVAQLAGVHLACEQVSQPLAKAIEWGRLAAYLEQSTRYIPYTDRRDGHYRYLRDLELLASPLGATYSRAMDLLFDTYSAAARATRAASRRDAAARAGREGAQPRDPGARARPDARPAPGGDGEQRRHVRVAPGVRAARAPPSCAPATGGARIRRAGQHANCRS